MTDGVRVQNLLRERVAEEVRALMARRMMTGADLAAKIGRSPMYVSRRVRGEVGFDLDDMQRLAEVFEVDVLDLMPRPIKARSDPNGGSGSLVRKGDPRPVRHVAPRPFVAPRRDPARPISTVPPNRRRPMTVGSPGHPMPR